MRACYLIASAAALALAGCAADQPTNIANEAVEAGSNLTVPREAAPAGEAPTVADTAPAPATQNPGNGAAPAVARPAPPAKETPAPRPQPRNQAAARPQPQPEPSPTSNTSCTPEHAAMGHCEQ